MNNVPIFFPHISRNHNFSVAMPCFVYPITIDRNFLGDNFLEKIVLETLKDARGITASERIDHVAEILCIDRELIQYIADILYFQKELDNNYIPLSSQYQQIQKTEPIVSQTIYVFKEALEGTLVPYLSNFDSNIMSQSQERTQVEFTKGSKGQEYTYKVDCIERLLTETKPPTQDEICRLMSDSDEIFSPEGKIYIGSASPCFLVFGTVLKETQNEMFLTYNNKILMRLSKIFRTKSPTVFDKKIREYTSNDSPSKSNYSGDINSKIDKLKQYLQYVRGPSQGSNDDVERREKYGSIMKRIAEIYEETFRNFVNRNKYPYSPILDEVEMEKIIVGLGLEIPNNKSIISPPRKAKNDTLIPLCRKMLISADRHLDHPFRIFLKAHPKFLNKINEVKSIRDAYAHGAYQELQLNSEKTKEYLDLLCACLQEIDEFYIEKEVIAQQKEINRINLKAILEMQDTLGMGIYDLISQKKFADVRYSLLEMEKDREKNPKNVINHMYNVFDQVLRIVVESLSPPSKLIDHYTEMERVQDAFKPLNLRCKPDFFRDTMMRKDFHSLGATALVFLWHHIQKPQGMRKIIELSEFLTSNRGHGEGKEINPDELDKKIEELYSQIKVILEEYNG